MKNAFKIFDYKGTPVYLKYWFFILLLFLSFKTVLALFISILVHELAHTFVAKKLGYYVESVFLDLFHGGALVDRKYEDNQNDAIKIIAAGPISNIILFCLAFFSTIVFADSPMIFDFMFSLTIVNAVLAIFNLLPIYPLDGGRITKALFQKWFGQKGQIYNGYTSIIFASALLIYAIAKLDIILIFFCVIFIIFSYNEIKPLQNN